MIRTEGFPNILEGTKSNAEIHAVEDLISISSKARSSASLGPTARAKRPPSACCAH